MDHGVTQAVVEKHIREEVSKLGDGDVQIRARALAGLVVLLTQLPEPFEVPQELVAALPSLYRELDAEGDATDSSMQANACALLSGLMASDDSLHAHITADGVVAKLQRVLGAAAGGQAHSLQLNACACLSQALRGNEAAAEALAAAGGLAPVLQLCDPALPVRVQEAAADAVCAVACSEAARDTLAEQGGVAALAKLLATEDRDVQMRALMGLGMLLAKNAANQRQVASDTEAVQRLMALMRQQDDLDCRIVARDLFGGLANSAECKDLVAQAIRVPRTVGTS